MYFLFYILVDHSLPQLSKHLNLHTTRFCHTYNLNRSEKVGRVATQLKEKLLPSHRRLEEPAFHAHHTKEPFYSKQNWLVATKSGPPYKFLQPNFFITASTMNDKHHAENTSLGQFCVATWLAPTVLIKARGKHAKIFHVKQVIHRQMRCK